MEPDEKTVHDRDVYERLLVVARDLNPDVRESKMFGSPAVFHGRKMALCVFGNEIGMKVPEEIANEARQAADVMDFQPYGKSRMREWIKIPGSAEAMDQHRDLLLEAILYAERLDRR